uniref:Uncharacterized protein n=1 Tax=Citrifermentans bremense TaxID=60035 RepID=A0A6S6LXQ0_9BACT
MGSSVILYNKHYTYDKTLAIAVNKLDVNFTWSQTSFGVRTEQAGCALYLTLANRTKKMVERIYVAGNCYLLDNDGNQYSSVDNNFYWMDGRSSSFNAHSSVLAPNARLQGFVLFPKLRSFQKFKRFFFKCEFWIDSEMHQGNYDVELIWP